MSNIAPNRVYAQYRDKPKALAWYNIVPTLGRQIETVYEDIRFSYDIDNNEGAQLDVIGNIVDITRTTTDDEIFKLLLRAKIAKNNSDATLDSILQATRFITGIQETLVRDNENMTFQVEFLNPLTPEQRNIFNEFQLMPKPQGVDFLGFVEYIPDGGDAVARTASASTSIMQVDTLYYSQTIGITESDNYAGSASESVVIVESLPATT